MQLKQLERNRPDQGQHYGAGEGKSKLISCESQSLFYQAFPQLCIIGFWYEKLQVAAGAILIVNLCRHICVDVYSQSTTFKS